MESKKVKIDIKKMKRGIRVSNISDVHKLEKLLHRRDEYFNNKSNIQTSSEHQAVFKHKHMTAYHSLFQSNALVNPQIDLYYRNDYFVMCKIMELQD